MLKHSTTLTNGTNTSTRNQRSRSLPEGARPVNSSKNNISICARTKLLPAIAKGFGAYHCQLDGVEGAPLSDQAYGAAGIYCYCSRLLACHKVFNYLGKDRNTLMAEAQAKYLIAAYGSSIFHASQLRALSTFSITTLEQSIATP
jgi:hypothetical protein